MLNRLKFQNALTDKYIFDAFVSRHGGVVETFFDSCPPERLDAIIIAHLDTFFAECQNCKPHPEDSVAKDLSDAVSLANKIIYAFQQDAWIDYKDDKSRTTYTWDTMNQLFDFTERLYKSDETPVARSDSWRQFVEDIFELIHEKGGDDDPGT